MFALSLLQSVDFFIMNEVHHNKAYDLVRYLLLLLCDRNIFKHQFLFALSLLQRLVSFLSF